MESDISEERILKDVVAGPSLEQLKPGFGLGKINRTPNMSHFWNEKFKSGTFLALPFGSKWFSKLIFKDYSFG